MRNDIKPNEWDYPSVARVTGGLIWLFGWMVGVMFGLLFAQLWGPR